MTEEEEEEEEEEVEDDDEDCVEVLSFILFKSNKFMLLLSPGIARVDNKCIYIKDTLKP